MATNNAVNVGLSGSTGTGNFVGANTPTLITPNLGIATATSLAFNPTTNGVIGTTTNNNVVAGSVGELISSSVIFASAVAMATTATAYNITTISLTAGDWDVWGNVAFNITTVAVFASVFGWISSTSATIPDLSLCYVDNTTAVSGGALSGTIAPLRFSLPSTTTIYLSGEWSSAGATISGAGNIYARRRR